MSNQKRAIDRTDSALFERQMKIARQVMEGRWAALRALALGDAFPEMEIDARIRMARQEAADRKA